MARRDRIPPRGRRRTAGTIAVRVVVRGKISSPRVPLLLLLRSSSRRRPAKVGRGPRAAAASAGEHSPREFRLDGIVALEREDQHAVRRRAQSPRRRRRRASRVAVAARLGVGERNVEGKETNLEKARVGTRAEEREERGRLLFASELASDRARAGRGGFNIVRHGDRPASLRLVGVVAGGPEVSRESRRVRVRLGEAPRARCGSVVRGLDGPNGDGGVEDLALRVAGLAPGAGEVERAHGGFRAPKTQREREGTRGDAPLARRLPRGCVLTHEGERRVVRVARVRGLEQHRRLGGEGAISRVSAERPDRDGSPTQVGHAVPAHATGVVSQTGSVLGHDAIEVDASGGRRGRGHSARGVVTDPGTAGAFS